MTQTTYIEKSTNTVISEEEFFLREMSGDKDVDVICTCLECGKRIPVYEICDCEFEKDTSYEECYTEYDTEEEDYHE